MSLEDGEEREERGGNHQSLIDLIAIECTTLLPLYIMIKPTNLTGPSIGVLVLSCGIDSQGRTDIVVYST